MYSRHQSPQCLICHQDIDRVSDLFHLFYHPTICSDCIKKFDIVDVQLQFYNYSLRILYRYNDFIRQLIYQYKGLDDYCLKDIFFSPFQDLVQQYQHYLFVVIPSSQKDNQRRGFCPNEAIIASSFLHVFTGLYKKSDYKQTHAKHRQDIHHVLAIQHGHLLKNQKVILFDDVLTSGNTLKAAIALVEAYHPASIELLVLSSKQIDGSFH